MICYGCYKVNVDGYCNTCRKKLFDGKKVSHVLLFDAPKEQNLPDYQEKTKRLSISGVQLKYSLRLEKNELQITGERGEYIIKPVPPAGRLVMNEQAPENEHLTMQIASQVFEIPVAANALIFFNDGMPAYITRRFDVRPDGTRHLQEDFAQISGKTENNDGENYKYKGTYADIGMLIKQHVAAYPPVLEEFFKLVLFNYIFSNGDAHLKNFSLIQSAFGDYTLTRAYDLMCTVLHTPQEGDTALDLYDGDMDDEFYAKNGCYGRSNFTTLAERIGLPAKRTDLVFKTLLSNEPKVVAMIDRSFLTQKAKDIYAKNFLDKIKRFR